MNTRPYPPANFINSDNWQPYTRLIPASEVSEWVNRQILSDTGNIHNPDHEHLVDADLCFIWASGSFAKSGRIVLGQCEQVMMRAGGWQKSRMEQQMHEWFGRIPKFIITLAADYCEQCNDLEFCALVEHELYHIAQATDDYGAPKFNKETGMPVLKLRGHDVEEFVGVVRRYGASKDVQEMVDAANRPAEVAHIDVARACGTCMQKLAWFYTALYGRWVMAALKPEVRAFIIQELACFDTPSQIVESVQKEFKVQVTRQQVASHDPTKAAGKGLAKKWVDLFNDLRDRFLNEISDIPIANKAYRLRVLQRMSTTAENMKNIGMTAQLLEQAAKEVGEAYSNKQKVEHTSPDGSMSPRPTTIRLVGVEPTNGKSG